jgi:hypothetical protein
LHYAVALGEGEAMGQAGARSQVGTIAPSAALVGVAATAATPCTRPSRTATGALRRCRQTRQAMIDAGQPRRRR